LALRVDIETGNIAGHGRLTAIDGHRLTVVFCYIAQNHRCFKTYLDDDEAGAQKGKRSKILLPPHTPYAIS
jgi:hypothetical protein